MAPILRKQPVARAIWPSTSASLHGIRLWWLSDGWGIAFSPNVGGAPCAAIPLPKKGSGASSWLVPRLCRGEGGGHVANAMSLPSEPPESRHTVPLPPSRIRLDARSGQTRIWSPGRTGCGGMAAGAEPTELTDSLRCPPHWAPNVPGCAQRLLHAFPDRRQNQELGVAPGHS